jgi:hypothetical protein
MNIYFTLQYNVCVIKATSFYSMSNSAWCERLFHLIVSMIQADVNI